MIIYACTTETNVVFRLHFIIYVGNNFFQDLPSVYNSVPFSATLERVDFQMFETIPVVLGFAQERLLNEYILAVGWIQCYLGSKGQSNI